MQNYEWESGTRFGLLMCTGKAYRNEKSRLFIEVICKCGVIKWMRFDTVKIAQSCGCLNIERVKNNPCNIKHGLNKHPLWNVFRSMIDRCYRPSSNRFKNYGAKGVIMCQEWRKDYPAFYKWAINNGWAKGLQLDKDIKYKENNGADTGMIYSPEYCRFVTSLENNRNRTTSRFLDFKGQRKTSAEWAEQLGLTQQTISNRLNNLGWDVEKTLSTPVKISK